MKKRHKSIAKNDVCAQEMYVLRKLATNTLFFTSKVYEFITREKLQFSVQFTIFAKITLKMAKKDVEFSFHSEHSVQLSLSVSEFWNFQPIFP